jgi:phage baseplate assembly protein gpV
MTTPDFLHQTAGQTKEEQRVWGVASGVVVNNIDLTGESRVQVSLTWLPGVAPWARVVTPSAGLNRGIYFMPQFGDEVIVAFNQGDITDAYILGGVWNGLDRPPAGMVPTDPVAKRLIRTPTGHSIELDDLMQSVTVTSATQQSVTLDPTGVTIVAGLPGAQAKLTLDSAGNITLEGAVSISLKAPSISLEATLLALKSTASASLEATGTTSITGALVKINSP